MKGEWIVIIGPGRTGRAGDKELKGTRPLLYSDSRSSSHLGLLANHQLAF